MGTENWIVARSHLHCAVLHTSPGDLKSKLPNFAKELRKKLCPPDVLVDLHRQRQDELQILLYHAPFRDRGLLYGLLTKASREVPGDCLEWKQWPSQWSMFPRTSRVLEASWTCGKSGSFTISMVTGSEGPADLANFSLHLTNWRNANAPEFRSIASNAVSAFAHAIGLRNEQLESPSRNDPLSIAKSDEIGIYNVTLIDQALNECFLNFEKSVKAVSDVIGKADYVQFRIGLGMRNVYEGFESLKNVPKVWSHYRTNWIPHTTDIYALPSDTDFVRAYPLLTVHYKDEPKLCFQINIVHAHGESLIECQVYEDKKWFDIISQFFEAPIDIWEGPLESRFGWYGDATDGRIVRHETSPERLIGTHAEVAQSAPKQVKAFLLLPLGVDYGGPNDFYVVDQHERYEDPVGIFKSRSAAIKFAKENPDAILGNRDLFDIILALAGEDFSFDTLPMKSRNKLRELLEIKDKPKPDGGARNFRLAIELQTDGSKALELLGENAYRILETQIEETEFRTLQKRIKEGRFDMKFRNKIAKLFDLEFADWQHEMYAGEEQDNSGEGSMKSR